MSGVMSTTSGRVGSGYTRRMLLMLISLPLLRLEQPSPLLEGLGCGGHLIKFRLARPLQRLLRCGWRETHSVLFSPEAVAVPSG
jgi:hypothetical protein